MAGPLCVERNLRKIYIKHRRTRILQFPRSKHLRFDHIMMYDCTIIVDVYKHVSSVSYGSLQIKKKYFISKRA